VIAFGRILRSSGLDELPQFVNVIRGEMSLIGPRPCTVYEFSKYEDWQKDRFNAFPGLTGLWQVSGKNKTTFKEMILLDIAYASRMSLKTDIMITLKTFPVLLGQVYEMFRKRRRH
jgi:exopolysaccharide production protein ExoY